MHTSCVNEALFNHAFLFSLLQEKISQQSLQSGLPYQSGAWTPVTTEHKLWSQSGL